MPGELWSNQRVDLIILQEAVSGFSGLFGYSPSIGPGNLIVSIAAVAGTDPYGNAYPAGISAAGGFFTGSDLQGNNFEINPQGAFFYTPAGTSTAGSFVGAYLNPSAFGSGTTIAQAETNWTTITGRSLPVRRVYFGTDGSGNPMPASITGPGTGAGNGQQADAVNGVKNCISIRPAYNPVSATDLAKIDTYLASCKNAGLEADVGIWIEPFFQGLTSTQFINAFNYYAPTVKKYFPAVFCMSASSAALDNETSYFPGTGPTGADKVVCDFYAHAYYTNAIRLDIPAAVADTNGLPFGVWECNNDSTNNNTQLTTFYDYNETFMAARTAASKVNADWLFFNSTGSISVAMTSGADFRVPLYQAIFDGITVPPSPGTQQLIASITPGDGLDPNGFPYFHIMTTYAGNGPLDLFASFRQNGFVFGTNQNGPGGTGALVFEAPETIRVQTRLLATDPNTPNVDESWHSLTAGNGWTGTVHYRLTPENELQIYAVLTSPGSAVNNVTIVTFPAPYPPTNITMSFNATHTGTTNFEEQFNVGTSGALQSTGVGTSAQVIINETIPLDVP